ncbi:hypothetical protein LSAT2_001371 [Lamellibrachia satsuma]|nr:hypothetical protein LSAT2_001371 [Lamellibrachia satsuma]
MQSYVYVRQLYDRSPVVYLISDRRIRDPDRYEGDTTSSSSPPCGHPARELLTHQLITAAYYAGCIDGRACRQQIAVMSDLRISSSHFEH